MRRIIGTALALAIIVGVALPTLVYAGGNKYARLTVTVKSAYDKQSIGDASVVVKDRAMKVVRASGKTDAEGKVTLGIKLPAAGGDTYVITVSAAGYQTDTTQMGIWGEGNQGLTVNLQKGE